MKILGSCNFYLVHPDSKKLLDVTFFVAINDGNVLLSCKTTLVLGLIQLRSRPDYLPPRASLITSSMDHPMKTKPVKISVHTFQRKVSTQSQTQEISAQAPLTTIAKKQGVSKLIMSKEQILTHYPHVFEGIVKFHGPPYNIQLTQAFLPNKHLATQSQFILGRTLNKRWTRCSRQES